MSDERDNPPDAVLMSLDAEPGPLPSLSEPAAQALTWRVVERWAHARAAAEAEAAAGGPVAQLSAATERKRVRARPRWLQGLLAAGFVLSLTGLAFGALRVWGPLAPSTPASKSTAKHAEGTRQRSPKKRPPDGDPPPTAPATPVPSASPQSTDAASAPPTIVPSLDRANALRATRAWQPAKRLYLRIATEAELPRERYVAAVAAAALCVQHTGEPQRALGLYATALSAWPEGDLSEEIRLGIAHAQRALERPRAEAAALRDFLAHHASSANADAAQERLEELTEPPLDPTSPNAEQ